MKVAVVGATGLVGSKMLEVLAERKFPVTELIPVASERSVGKKVHFQNREWTVVSATDAITCQTGHRHFFSRWWYFPWNGHLNLRQPVLRLLIIHRHGEWTLQKN